MTKMYRRITITDEWDSDVADYDSATPEEWCREEKVYTEDEPLETINKIINNGYYPRLKVVVEVQLTPFEERT